MKALIRKWWSRGKSEKENAAHENARRYAFGSFRSAQTSAASCCTFCSSTILRSMLRQLTVATLLRSLTPPTIMSGQT